MELLRLLSSVKYFMQHAGSFENEEYYSYFAQSHLGHIQSRDTFRPRERKHICRWTIDKAIFTVLLLVE